MTWRSTPVTSRGRWCSLAAAFRRTRATSTPSSFGEQLSLPGRALDPTAIERCRAAYRDGVADTAPTPPTQAEVDVGYRHRFVALSLRVQLLSLPGPQRSGRTAELRDAAARAWWGRRRSRVTANLHRVCDEAHALLAAVR
jgi:hypothetical protein